MFDSIVYCLYAIPKRTHIHKYVDVDCVCVLYIGWLVRKKLPHEFKPKMVHPIFYLFI